ncbi:MAG: hypothetical protein ACETWM_09590 [Candidatus Lokiarchaeia archaeon]
MSRGALLTGTAGGIIGTITAIMGMAFIGVTNNYILEISNYIEDFNSLLTKRCGYGEV